MAKPPRAPALNNHVFINCPFDDDYWPMFRAIVFAVWACGYRSRCALENNGGALNLVLARKREQWRPSVFDLAGLDPTFHTDEPRTAMEAVRDFLARTPDGVLLPGVQHLWRAYDDFQQARELHEQRCGVL